jgi:hypothetical protein
MVKIEEHKNKMQEIKKQANRSKGRQRLQLLKCYHRMQKELLQCQMFINEIKRNEV